MSGKVDIGSAPHADHYKKLKPQPIEVIEGWTHLPFHLSEALAHIARVGIKGTPEDWIKDLDMAAWYCQRYATVLKARSSAETAIVDPVAENRKTHPLNAPIDFILREK